MFIIKNPGNHSDSYYRGKQEGLRSPWTSYRCNAIFFEEKTDAQEIANTFDVMVNIEILTISTKQIVEDIKQALTAIYPYYEEPINQFR